jgi:hypothetical protein
LNHFFGLVVDLIMVVRVQDLVDVTPTTPTLDESNALALTIIPDTQKSPSEYCIFTFS